MFDCTECGRQHVPEIERWYQLVDWCDACTRAEQKRSALQDSTTQGLRSRPPKYMLHPNEYGRFGY